MNLAVINAMCVLILADYTAQQQVASSCEGRCLSSTPCFCDARCILGVDDSCCEDFAEQCGADVCETSIRGGFLACCLEAPDRFRCDVNPLGDCSVDVDCAETGGLGICATLCLDETLVLEGFSMFTEKPQVSEECDSDSSDDISDDSSD